MQKLKLFISILMIFPTLALSQTTINVPDDYPTIQEGLNNAQEGDTVLVASGTYQENIIWPMKDSVSLVGSDNLSTIIDGNSQGTTIYINSGDPTDLIAANLENLKINNGGNTDYGGGIAAINSNLNLNNLFINNCNADNKGAGIYLKASIGNITNSEIKNSEALYNGGIAFVNSHFNVENSIISQNRGLNRGSGIGLSSNSRVFINNSNIIDNIGQGGIGLIENSKCFISNTNIENNEQGIVMFNADSLTLDDVEVVNNYHDATGCGIYSWQSNNILINNSKIEGNRNSAGTSGDVYGGGLYFASGKIEIKDTKIINNKLITSPSSPFGNDKSAKGAGGYFTNATLIMNNCIVKGNSAKLNDNGIIPWGSGGLYISGTNSTIENSAFASNKGGSSNDIQINSGSTSNNNFSNVQFRDNFANHPIISIGSESTSMFENCNFSNLSNNYGRLISNFGKLTISNSNVINNACKYFIQNNGTFNGSNNNFINTKDMVINNVSGNSTIQQSNFINNNIAVNNQNNSQVLNMQNNYWGDDSGPYHPSQNTTGQGDTTSQYVNITPWLATPDTSAPPIPALNVNASLMNDTITLSWDSSKMQDLAGYIVYYDTDTSGYPYSNSVDVGNKLIYKLNNLLPSTTYYLAVKTYDIDGNESWYSHEVQASTRVLEAQNLSLGNQEGLQHVINHTPLINYDYYDSMGEPQTHYQVQVSTYADYSQIDVWDSGVIASDNTSIEYSGDQLIDGEKYYLRVTVGSNDFFGNWSSVSFRMNSEPTTPILASPANNAIMEIGNPELVIQNSSDNEGDELTYNYLIASDSTFTNIIDSSGYIQEGSDSTVWQVAQTLQDNNQFWWKVRSYDSYEYSEYSEISTFQINSENDPPEEFQLLSPNNGEENLDDTLDFVWETAIDKDPLDYAEYTIYFSSDSTFENVDYTSSVNRDTTFSVKGELSDNAKYYWYVEAMDTDSLTTKSEIYHFVIGTVTSISEGNHIPKEFALEQNFPNPFNPSTNIRFALPVQSSVTIRLFNSLGQEILELVNQEYNAGMQTVSFDASSLSSGIYFYSIEANGEDGRNFVKTRKMILMK